MSTYQDRAIKILEKYAGGIEECLYGRTYDELDEDDRAYIDNVVSELASIVEEVIGKDEVYFSGKKPDLDYWPDYDAYKRNELRQEQRDQLSNRSKPNG